MSSKKQHDRNTAFPSSCIIPRELRKIKIDIENLQFFTCQEDGLRVLSKKEIEIVHFWFGKITKSFKSGNLVFRGQNQTNLIKQLDKEFEKLTDECEKQYHIDHYLYHRLFFFGEKARCFYSGAGPHDFLQPEKSCCVRLFNEIKRKLSSPPGKLSTFIQQNQPLFTFFQCDNNISIFCDALCREEKLYWYYSILLHRLGKTRFLSSQYISISKNILVSDSFSISEKNKHSLIIMYVIPNNQPGEIYSALEINNSWQSLHNCIIENNLPPLSSWPYDNQQEVTIPGCIFPHYMWFVIDKKGNRIIVNPHILTVNNRHNPCLHIEIDQKDFDERLRRETGYANGIFYDDFSGQHEII